MNPIVLFFLILLCLGAFGGGSFGWYPANYGYFGGGGLLIIVLLLFLFLR